jgi:bacterioferritin-associated ferredoxin
MIVCHCAGVSDHTITELVRSGVSTLKEVVLRNGAGRCCGPCRDEIRSLVSGATSAPTPVID